MSGHVPPAGYRDLDPDAASHAIEAGELAVVDVRTPQEWMQGVIPGAVLMPLDELQSRLSELDPDRPLLVVCQHGIRSAAAAGWLAREAGFSTLFNLRGGMSRWSGPVEPPGSRR